MALKIGNELNDTLKGTALVNVWEVDIVYRIPFYGYHGFRRPFVKISLISPGAIREAAHLMRSGQILGRVFTPYEAHIPFTLQFMADYNLYCMDDLIVRRLRFRGNPSKEILGMHEF
ncbi:hypothetical protein BJ684DRAFT_18190 [Piptocephalis cylindrospora]|uniref:DNA polymerase delta/zeta catalytic subunit N-terminal domain-containing protein n=1 Tax=Piptocephalis cylindrospora TaxID=1907219 RepID=A0A4P9Y8J3_9FUNG|nr:hypothetical protein BJ684DRAFT_18190 [Piptocephalis cylindrospora]|eukprot:RKP15487.1 hypothetical protein BJ684DRAFT_18190 [Piptocephalis cylindrospora]